MSQPNSLSDTAERPLQSQRLRPTEQQIDETQEWLRERQREVEMRGRVISERSDELQFGGIPTWELERRRRTLRVDGRDIGNNCAVSRQNFQCVICLEALDNHDAHQSLCGHYWCRPCINKRFESAANSMYQFPAHCCHLPIAPDNHAFINAETWARYFETRVRYFDKKEEVKAPNPTFCSKRECSKFIPVQRINEGRAMCVCGQVTCADCKSEWHTGECVVDAATEEFLNLARQEHWQKCPHCGAMTDRIDGCNEMSMSNLPVPCRGFCFEVFTNDFAHRLQPMSSPVLLCVWQEVEDMSL